MLNKRQTDVLLKPIHPSRVYTHDGMSYLAAYDVRAHLDRIFGFAMWSADCTDLTMLYEQSKVDGSTTRWRAAYRATLTLRIHDTDATYTESATGTNFGWLPDGKRADAHDMAIKTATSQALKRCATNLGDQFGLSLYAKGSTKPLVLGVIGHGVDEVVPPKVTSDDAHPEDVIGNE